VQLPIESQFIGTIPDNLNAEIVLGTVQVGGGLGKGSGRVVLEHCWLGCSVRAVLNVDSICRKDSIAAILP
jgi:hypothetical protein